MRVLNSKLSETERIFAQEHHKCVYLYLRQRHLSIDEWYDIAVFGYLKAVRLWLGNPSLQKWAFSTIAANNMRSAISSYAKNQKNRPMRNVVSLDAPVGEAFTNNLYEFLHNSCCVETDAEYENAINVLRSCLSENDQRVFLLRLSGHTYKEIGSLLSLSEGTVYGRFQRAVSQYRNFIKEQVF